MESILRSTRRPDVTFYQSGRIDICARVAKILHLEDGDVIDIGLQDGEYYLYVRAKSDKLIGRHEAQCFASKKRSRNFRAYSRRLSNAILRCMNTSKARVPAGNGIEIDSVGIVVPLVIRINIAD